VEEFGVQLAINGSYFYPFEAGIFLWDFYPHSGDPVNISGLAISNGQTYSSHQPEFAVICFEAKSPRIQSSQCPSGTTQALSGNQILVDEGVSSISHDNGNLHPRTAVAVNQDRTRLWLIVIDGRQKNYSEGVTLSELADIALEIGAYEALNLDGGGSTTMVMMDGDEIQTLNSPIHKRIPMWERPVGNHLGIFVLNEDGDTVQAPMTSTADIVP
jgi:exopolysaccharide biosynthesis protein